MAQEGHRPRDARPQTRQVPTATFAAVDLGTNNCRLLVARQVRGGFRVIDAFSRIVRLGEGLNANGRLSEAAINRAIDALKICATKMHRRRVTHARSVATEACRRAANCDVFLDQVQRETGLDVEIISSNEEAHLAVEGCVPLLLPAYSYALIFDIGGGSTELIWLDTGLYDRPRILGTASLPCGVIGVSEHYGGREASPEIYAAMVEEVTHMLRPFEAEHGIRDLIAAREVQLLGTSGTVTTLAGIYMELPRYDRSAVDGSYLTFEEAEVVSDRVVAMTYEERVAHPCIGTDRADLVVAGTAIFAAICQMWPVGQLRVADRGLREGILLGLMDGIRADPQMIGGRNRPRSQSVD